ncbi:MAG: hypothetical protein ACYDHW_10910 [Syntrophorhabdaceae bacterium]
MEQLQLLLRDKQKEVSIEVIKSCPTFNAALKLCKEISGYTDDQICLHMGWTAPNFSLIWNTNGNKRHFPENDLQKYMDLCGNKVPLIWLSLKCGYTLTPLKTELELELENAQKEADEYRKKYEYAIEALRAVKG